MLIFRFFAIDMLLFFSSFDTFFISLTPLLRLQRRYFFHALQSIFRHFSYFSMRYAITIIDGCCNMFRAMILF